MCFSAPKIQAPPPPAPVVLPPAPQANRLAPTTEQAKPASPRPEVTTESYATRRRGKRGLVIPTSMGTNIAGT